MLCIDDNQDSNNDNSNNDNNNKPQQISEQSTALLGDVAIA